MGKLPEEVAVLEPAGGRPVPELGVFSVMPEGPLGPLEELSDVVSLVVEVVVSPVEELGALSELEIGLPVIPVCDDLDPNPDADSKSLGADFGFPSPSVSTLVVEPVVSPVGGLVVLSELEIGLSVIPVCDEVDPSPDVDSRSLGPDFGFPSLSESTLGSSLLAMDMLWGPSFWGSGPPRSRAKVFSDPAVEVSVRSIEVL